MAKLMRLIILSGRDDGTVLEYDVNRDGVSSNQQWTLSIGRKDDNDIVLRHDTFVSRQHAKIHLMQQEKWLEDLNSTNGSFIENLTNFFEDHQITGRVRLKDGQPFRIGRTWLRIETVS